MTTLIKNGRVITATDDYIADIFIVWGNVIRTGLMLNAGKSQVDEMVEAIDAGLALASV